MDRPPPGTGAATLPLGYYRTDPVEDVLSSLEALCCALGAIRRSKRAWKWAILSADMLVTSALVQFNSGNLGIGALIEKQRQDLAKWYNCGERKDEHRPGFKLHIDFLGNLLDLARSEYLVRNTPPLVISDNIASNILKMHEILRNDLIHFKDAGWLIDLASVPSSIDAVLEVTGKALGPNCPIWPEQRDEIERLTVIAKRRLQQLRGHPD
jgi:hypothetical protein